MAGRRQARDKPRRVRTFVGDPEEGTPVDCGNMSGTRQAPVLKLDFASAYRQFRALLAAAFPKGPMRSY